MFSGHVSQIQIIVPKRFDRVVTGIYTVDMDQTQSSFQNRLTKIVGELQFSSYVAAETLAVVTGQKEPEELESEEARQAALKVLLVSMREDMETVAGAIYGLAAEFEARGAAAA